METEIIRTNEKKLKEVKKGEFFIFKENLKLKLNEFGSDTFDFKIQRECKIVGEDVEETIVEIPKKVLFDLENKKIEVIM